MKSKHYRSILSTTMVSITVLGLMVYLSSFAFGEEKEKKDLPPRKISVAPEYTGVVVDAGEDVSVDLEVTNGGRQDENVQLTLTTVPKGWEARIKTYSFDVTGVYLESDKSKTLTLKAEPDKDVGPGTCTFVVKARSLASGS